MKGLIENYAKRKICIIFFSKLPECLHLAFKLIEKHCPLFFPTGLHLVFEKKTHAKKLPGSMFLRSFVERETEETFCLSEQ